MNRTDENRNGIIGILHRARVYNHEIGNYQEHMVNEQFNFAVMLTNGRIVIPMTMAQDQEVQPSSISEDRIQRVANGFQSNNLIARQQGNQANEPINSPARTNLSLWQKLLILLGLK